MSGTDHFYKLKREFGRDTDYALRMVVIVAPEQTDKGKYIGKGLWMTDMLLPDGRVLKGVGLNILHRIETNEEFVFLDEEAGEYAGEITDEQLGKLRFYINFASD